MILYINNFRGFKNTFIPIKDVNFLVGENSTGKTSVLKLIKLLSSPEFWNYQILETEYFKFGSFSEICSDKDGKSFEIGIYHDETIEGRIPLLFRFVNNKEMPKIKSIRCLYNSHDFELLYDNTQKENGQSIKVRYRYLTTKPVQLKLIDFESWVTSTNLDEKEFSYLEPDEVGFNTNSVFHTLYSVFHTIKFGTKSTSGTFGGALRLTTLISSDNLGPFNNVVWFAPIRTEPRKTYDSYNMQFRDDGSHIPYLLREIFAKANENKNMITLLQAFGKASGLYERISIKKFGEEISAPFELQVELDNKRFNLTNVGYGVSQVLPILVEILTPKLDTKFALQQPETHLHPKAQAALGEFFYESWLRENKKFFIETHSDYMVDRFRIAMSKNKRNYKKNGEKCQVLFFKRGKNGNEVYPIEIEADGKYTENRPAEFGEFFAKEGMDLYSLNFD
jgi:predicted ATP-dependent endonuclease of OLD family